MESGHGSSTAEAEGNVRKGPLSSASAPSLGDVVRNAILDFRSIIAKRPELPHIISPYYLLAPSVNLITTYLNPTLPPSWVVMSQSPSPLRKRPSESNLKLYTSQPSLEVPAVCDAGRPAPVKFMCVPSANMSLLPRRGADAVKVNTRIPKPATTPQARSFIHETSEGAIPLRCLLLLGDGSQSLPRRRHHVIPTIQLSVKLFEAMPARLCHSITCDVAL